MPLLMTACISMNQTLRNVVAIAIPLFSCKSSMYIQRLWKGRIFSEVPCECRYMQNCCVSHVMVMWCHMMSLLAVVMGVGSSCVIFWKQCSYMSSRIRSVMPGCKISPLPPPPSLSSCTLFPPPLPSFICLLVPPLLYTACYSVRNSALSLW